MKTASTNPLYQSTFMPIVEKAETEVKLLILAAFLHLWSEYVLRLKVRERIDEKGKALEKAGIRDWEQYKAGLLSSANAMIYEFYSKPKAEFLGMADMPATPAKVMLHQAKGSVRVKDYAKELKKRMAKLASEPMTTSELGKKPISLWQKAELDVRYENNMKMIQDQIDQGIDLCWLSSHPDCSKRCEKWQGKLVSLTKRSTMSGFRVGKVDGHWVYSLPDIMAQTDKYGYHNNIISGFNCRHHTIPYRGQKPPVEYTKGEVKKQRETETRIREMEREIRKTRKYAMFLGEAGDVSGAKLQRMKAEGMVRAYKAFCAKNGYAWEKYRITV